MAADAQPALSALRTPRAAAVAGIVFAILFGTVLVLIRLSLPANLDDARSWLTNSSQRGALHTAHYLVPFCGLAFLWFMGVLRSQIGDREDKFFATIFLGTGLLFVAMLFVSTAFAGGIASEAGRRNGSVPIDVSQFARPTVNSLVTNYGIRMAAVFTISTSMIGLRLGFFRRWLAFTGFAIGLFLLFVARSVPWIELLFPAWVLVVSIQILVLSSRSAISREGAASQR
jgi:hypothetical protein